MQTYIAQLKSNIEDLEAEVLQLKDSDPHAHYHGHEKCTTDHSHDHSHEDNKSSHNHEHNMSTIMDTLISIKRRKMMFQSGKRKPWMLIPMLVLLVDLGILKHP